MLDYLLGFIFLLTVYNKINIFLIKRRIKTKANLEIIKGAEPYFLPGKNRRGVLMIHGFSGTAYELKELGNFLNEKGLHVYAPLLSGHGTSPEHLFSAKVETWIYDVKKSLAFLGNYCDEIFILGYSFGGNLALLIGEEEPKVKGIISVSVPYVFKHEKLGRVLLSTLKHFKLFQKKRYSKKVVEAYKKKAKITYQQVPLYAVVQVWKGVKASRKKLSTFTKPILFIQSTADDFVSPESIDYAYNTIASKVKEKVWALNSFHALVFDENRLIYYQKMYEFIERN